jgi:SAM-dependent methyltransferase
MAETGAASFWEQPESVEKFASRDPDLRLMEILDRVSEPAELRVLDLGCAAGRNTAVLAARGFDFHALDSSRPMIAYTRKRVAAILGEQQAVRRVRLGKMDYLGDFTNASFGLVVALGVFHCASSRREWGRALDESARVLAPRGLLLLSAFTPETDLHGTGVRPIPGQPHLYSGFSSGRTYLVDAPTLDAEMADRALEPVVPSKTVRVELEKGRRVVVNALYEKLPLDAPSPPYEEGAVSSVSE